MLKSAHLLFLLLLVSCHPDKNKTVNVDNIRQKTSDGSILYFNNVRKSNYNLEELKQAGINIFDPKNHNNNNLTLKIIHNWRLDKAYLQIHSKDSTLLQVYFEQPDGEARSIILRDLNFNQQTINAIEIYNALINNRVIYKDRMLSDSLLFDKESFRITTFDFLRLTDNL